jgi:hypothetical protein
MIDLVCILEENNYQGKDILGLRYNQETKELKVAKESFQYKEWKIHSNEICTLI